MSATGALREEHVLILKALDLLVEAGGRSAAASPPAWAALIDWLRDFADARHHAKEERVLFPALEAAGVPRAGGPIAVMLDEHEQGRDLLRGLRDAPPAERVRLAREYTRLLRGHIDKENEVLFPLADAILEPPAVAVLLRAYAAADDEQGAATAPAAAEAALEALGARLLGTALAR